VSKALQRALAARVVEFTRAPVASRLVWRGDQSEWAFGESRIGGPVVPVAGAYESA